MLGVLDTAGERLAIECAPTWIAELIEEGSAGELRRGDGRDASVLVRVEADHAPFDTRGWEPLTRGAWRRDHAVVIENACTAGFDLHVTCAGDRVEIACRWRPPARDRAAARVLRSRFHLLARAVLMQYPALWWAGTRGRAPLHACAFAGAAGGPLLTAASGVGRSTLVARELAAGGSCTGDNLAVGDGIRVWGLVEPLRIEGASGRRMPHGRHEAHLRNRDLSAEPDCVVVLERPDAVTPSLVPCSSAHAARSLVTSTYMAGELRRFWGLAATLAAGTGRGPAHPEVAAVADLFARRLPCLVLTPGAWPGPRLSDLLNTTTAEAAA
jgi:hypothetical protein